MSNLNGPSTPLVTFIKTEGDIQTKLDAAKEKHADNIKRGAKTMAVVTPASIAIANAITNKYNPLNDTLVKGIDKTAKFTGKGLAKLLPKLKPTLQKIGKDFAKIPGAAKIIGVISFAAFTALEHISSKHAYNQGKIDQKYADIAKLKNKTTQMLE